MCVGNVDLDSVRYTFFRGHLEGVSVYFNYIHTATMTGYFQATYDSVVETHYANMWFDSLSDMGNNGLLIPNPCNYELIIAGGVAVYESYSITTIRKQEAEHAAYIADSTEKAEIRKQLKSCPIKR